MKVCNVQGTVLGTEDMKVNKISPCFQGPYLVSQTKKKTTSYNLSHTKISELRCCQIEKAQGKGRKAECLFREL